MALRTASTIQADYEAVHEAYLKALKAESASSSSGGGSRTIQRSKSTELLQQLRDLEREYKRVSGGGLRIFGVIPSV